MESHDFEVLVRDLLPPSYRMAQAILGDPAAAEDAVQEAALKAWRSLSDLKDRGAFRSWFFRIVANRCLTMRRGPTRWLVPLSARHPDHSDAEDKGSAAIDLDRALAVLPALDRLAVFSYYCMDLPVAEVATILGCSLGAARSRLSRATKRLRPSLDMEDFR